MSNIYSSCSESGSDSGSEGLNILEKTTQYVSDYENMRLKRMAENKARMEAMGLHQMAASLMGSGQIKEKNRKREAKGKKKVIEEDEDYKPDIGSETEEEDDDDDDDSFSGDSSGTKFNKAKKKSSTSSKKMANKNISSNSNSVDEDHDLMQAIALSLQESAGFLDVVDHGPSSSLYTRAKDTEVDKGKESSPNNEDRGRRKRKKLASNRVQMTEDELILHFFQFDEGGQASITLRDLRRVAADHDFDWSDKEMTDMINIFDSDGDGKLSLEDFRTIVGRCQMIQPVVDSKSY